MVLLLNCWAYSISGLILGGCIYKRFWGWGFVFHNSLQINIAYGCVKICMFSFLANILLIHDPFDSWITKSLLTWFKIYLLTLSGGNLSLSWELWYLFLFFLKISLIKEFASLSFTAKSRELEIKSPLSLVWLGVVGNQPTWPFHKKI